MMDPMRIFAWILAALAVLLGAIGALMGGDWGTVLMVLAGVVALGLVAWLAFAPRPTN